jgi:hypothetical protein
MPKRLLMGVRDAGNERSSAVFQDHGKLFKSVI